jgi:type II secretory pathway pseudopilin PulG
MTKIFCALIASLCICSSAYAGQLTYQFNSPSFNGGNTTASYWLGIEQLQNNAQQNINTANAAAQAQKQAAALSNPVNQFVTNLQSLVFQQLAKQLNNNLFGETSSNSGVLSLSGNTINYLKVGNNINLTITDTGGNITNVVVPVGSLSF